MRRFLFIAVLVLLLLAGLWTGAWHYFAQRIEAGVGDWARARRIEGMAVDYLTTKIDGFPLEWRLTVALPTLAGAGPTPWEWQGESVVARIRPWEPRDVPLLFPGVHVFAFGPAATQRRIAIAAARPDGRAVIGRDGQLDLLTLDLGTVRLRYAATEAPPAEIGRAQLTIQRNAVATANRGADTLDAALILDETVLPAAPLAGMGTRIVRAETDLSLKGKLPPGPAAQSVAAWRDDGGVVEINRVGLNWGPLELQGNGTITLDELNRPLGAFTARARGYGEAIDAVVAAGGLRPRDANGLKLALNLLARQSQGQTRPQLDVAISLQDGRLFVAGFPVAPLEPIRFE